MYIYTYICIHIYVYIYMAVRLLQFLIINGNAATVSGHVHSHPRLLTPLRSG